MNNFDEPCLFEITHCVQPDSVMKFRFITEDLSFSPDVSLGLITGYIESAIRSHFGELKEIWSLSLKVFKSIKENDWIVIKLYDGLVLDNKSNDIGNDVEISYAVFIEKKTRRGGVDKTEYEDSIVGLSVFHPLVDDPSKLEPKKAYQ